jgi:hypothetical protein
MDRTRPWSMVDPRRRRSRGSPKRELTSFVGSESSTREVQQGELTPRVLTGCSDGWWRSSDWSADGVSCETEWEQGTMGEPMTAFIGSRREEHGRETPGRRRRWDINGGISFEAEEKREGSRGGVNLIGEMKMVGWHIGSTPSWCERLADSRAQRGGARNGGGAIPVTKRRG